MEHTIKFEDQGMIWYVTFLDTEITHIDDGQQVYTPEHYMFKYAKRYVEDLMLTKLGYIV
jgi:hypothetical protein